MSAIAEGDRSAHRPFENETGPACLVRSAPPAAVRAPPPETRPVCAIAYRRYLDRFDAKQLPARATELMLDRVDVDAAHGLGVARGNEWRSAFPSAALCQHGRVRSSGPTEVSCVAESKKDEFEIMSASTPQPSQSLQRDDVLLIETSPRCDYKVINEAAFPVSAIIAAREIHRMSVI
jgi:hypothetical protein